MTHRTSTATLTMLALLASLACASPAHAQEALWSAEPDPEINPEPAPGPSHRVRYMVAPSAFMLEPGEGYVAQKQLLLTQVEYGVNDWFSVSATGIVPFWLPFLPEPVVRAYWLPNVIVGTKFGGRIIGDLHASFGASLTTGFAIFDYGSGLTIGSIFGLGIDPHPTGSLVLITPYGHLTYGTPDAHLTAGFSAPLTSIDGGGDRPLVPHFAGYLRATDWLGFAAEYWIYDNRVSDERRFIRPDFTDANQHIMGLTTRLDFAPFTFDLGAIFVPSLTSSRFRIYGIPWLEVSGDFGR